MPSSDSAPFAAYPMCFIDFEASCLPAAGSYPIELAVTHLDGRLSSWLIRPTSEWQRHGTWDPESARLHGISYEQLLSEGQDPAVVFAEFGAVVGTDDVLSDAPAADQTWLDTLAAAAGSRRSWRVRSAVDVCGALIATKHPRISQQAAEEIFADVSARAKARHPQEHRAGPDAQRMAEIVRLLITGTK